MGDDIYDSLGMDPFRADGPDKKKKRTASQRLILRGRNILAAGRELLPETLDLAAEGAAGFGDLYRAEAEKSRAAELEGFEEFGPRYVAAIDAADPLRAKAKGMVLDDLDEGLDESMRREVQQGSRAAWAARGLADSPAAATEELLTLGSAGKHLEQINLDRALQLIRNTDPFMAYAGRPSAPQGSNIMSPDYASYSNDLPSFQANTEIQHFNGAQANKNRKAQLQAAGIAAAGDIVGGAAGGFV
jgi:hypothetical protein